MSNSAITSVLVDLGWKLAFVLKGQAPEKQLDTYEQDRLPALRSQCAGINPHLTTSSKALQLGERQHYQLLVRSPAASIRDSITRIFSHWFYPLPKPLRSPLL